MPLPSPTRHVSWKELGVVLLLVLGVSISLVYFPITKYDIYDPATGGKEGDVAQYIRMSRGAPLETIPKPYRYRILTPYLAGCVPFLPRSVTQFYDIDADKIVKFKFGLVNMVALALTACALHVIGRRLGFTPLESLLGGLLFLTSFFVVTLGGVPLVDPWGYFFLVAAFLALLERRRWWLLLAVLVGMFAKETTVLIVLYVLFMPWSWRDRGLALLACIPGLLAYAIFRFALYPTNVGFHVSLMFGLVNTLRELRPGAHWFYLAFDGGMAFGAVWLLAIYGLLRTRRSEARLLVRLSWVAGITLLVPLLTASSLGRIWFYAFPIVIPLALIGLRGVFHAGDPPPADATLTA